MRVLAVPDKFRGTATAEQVCAAIAGAVVAAGSSCRSLPIADGGEGMLEAFGGPNRLKTVTGPAGGPVSAGWRMNADGLAVIESAQACGLLLTGGAAANDPVAATTRGVGELIVAALVEGAARILVGLGGSATTDGGRGAVDAVIDAGQLDAVRSVELDVCCDVETRFTDAARVFGPQKGASPADVSFLTDRLRSRRAEYSAQFGIDVEAIPGSGAAGGLAGGLAVIGASLVGGFDQIARELELDRMLADADLVITGEGKFDATSLAGKVVGGVWLRAAALGLPVVAIVGVQDPEARCDGLTVLSLTELYGSSRALSDTSLAITDAVAGYLATQTQRGH